MLILYMVIILKTFFDIFKRTLAHIVQDVFFRSVHYTFIIGFT